MRKFVVLVFLFLSFSNHSYASQPWEQKVDWVKLGKAWETYVDYPSSENANKVYILLPTKARIKYDGSYEAKETIETIYEGFQMLERQVYSGDRNALKLVFRLLSITDGGFLEDLDDLLGAQIRVHPRLFLEELKEHKKLVDIEDVVHVGFQVYTDRPRARLLDNQLRVKALLSVNDKALNPVRDECIKELTDQQ